MPAAATATLAAWYTCSKGWHKAPPAALLTAAYGNRNFLRSLQSRSNEEANMQTQHYYTRQHTAAVCMSVMTRPSSACLLQLLRVHEAE